MKVYIYPSFGNDADPGDGGVRRVVEAQRKYLPDFGIEVVDDPEEADVLASHITGPRDFFSRHAGKPLVAHNHGFYWREYSWEPWAEQANAEVMKLVKAADVVTAPSHWVANIIRRHSARDVRTVYHGVDLVDFEPVNNLDEPSYVLWNKTRVDAVCDPEAVVRLAVMLPEVQFVTTHLPESRPVQPANVVVMGREAYADAKARVRDAGVYLATTRETFGIGVLEAMAAGVPVVGWRFGGQEEVIENGVDGYLVDEGDYAGLAAAVREALRPETRARIGKASRSKIADQFQWKDRIGDYAAIYQELAPGKWRPRVSIVVTAYKVADFLEATLNSVKTQEDPDFECIIVDDSSPDGSRAIAEKFVRADPRFKLLWNMVNVGVAEARNIGIRSARGKYILPLDGDDQLTPRAVGVLADALDGDRTIDIAYGNVLFERDGVQAHSGWPVEFNLGAFFQGPGQPMPYSSLFRKRAWELTGGYRSRVRSSEDCDLWMRMISYGFDARMVTKADTLVYRIRQGSRSDTEGHADVENKTWFPWRDRPELAPAACGQRTPLPVAAVDPPLVSVIIPVGPGHEYLVKDAIDSVDAQTFRDFECIVVNDSGNELPELPAWVQVLEDSSSFWDERKHLGTAAARNAAIAESRAPLFICLDADDYLQPQALELLLQAFQQSIPQGGDIVYPDFWEDPEIEGQFKVWPFADYTPNLVLKRALHSVTALTPKKVWEAVGGYDGSAPWEDWDFQLKTAVAGFCSRRLAWPAFTYRKHTGTRRTDRYTRRQDALAEMARRWGEYFEGRKELGCAACGSRPTVNGPTNRGSFQARQDQGEGSLLRYTGDERGERQFRGRKSGRPYLFARGTVRFVLEEDVPGFLERSTFIKEGELPAAGPEPVLVANSAPNAPPLLAHNFEPDADKGLADLGFTGPFSIDTAPVDLDFKNELIDTPEKAAEMAARRFAVDEALPDVRLRQPLAMPPPPVEEPKLNVRAVPEDEADEVTREPLPDDASQSTVGKARAPRTPTKAKVKTKRAAPQGRATNRRAAPPRSPRQ